MGKKLEIIDELQSGFLASQRALEYGIGIQTVRGMYKNQDSLVDYALPPVISGNIVKRESLKKSKFQELDAGLFEWYKCLCSEGVSMTGPALVEKAQRLYNEVSIEGMFNASSDWLTRVKYHNGISL